MTKSRIGAALIAATLLLGACTGMKRDCDNALVGITPACGHQKIQKRQQELLEQYQKQQQQPTE